MMTMTTTQKRFLFALLVVAVSIVVLYAIFAKRAPTPPTEVSIRTEEPAAAKPLGNKAVIDNTHLNDFHKPEVSPIVQSMQQCLGVETPFEIYQAWKTPAQQQMNWVVFLSLSSNRRYRFDFEKTKWKTSIYEVDDEGTPDIVAEDSLPPQASPSEHIPEDTYEVLKEEYWMNNESDSIRIITRDNDVEEMEISEKSKTFYCQKGNDCRCQSTD